jgi:type VI secretion system protein VasG
MLVDHKYSIGILTPTARAALESAVSRAAGGQYYEVSVEHFLFAMLESDDGDIARILNHFGQDKARLSERVQRVLARAKTGANRRPVFDEDIFQWIEDAWTVASLEGSASRLRTGALFAQFITRQAKYTAESYPETEAIGRDELRAALPEILSRSKENVEAAPPPQGGPGGRTEAAPGQRGNEALKKFCTNYTERARAGTIDPIFGRHAEIRQMVDILARRRKNNPIIVGDPGVGKTALVEGLARSIAEGDVPDILRNVDLLGLDLGLLQAGAGVKGEFENRLKAVISEVKGSPKPIVLFIDEAHTIIGAGGQQGGSDAANILKPELARGELRTIAATTWAEYKKYFEKDAALARRFQAVKVDEPSETDAVLMMRGLRATYEDSHKIPIRDEAIVASVKLSHRYIAGRLLPDKAVDLLDTAAARVKIELDSKPEEVVSLEVEIAAIERERDALKRDIAAGTPTEDAAERVAELEKKHVARREDLAAITARWETERAAALAVRKAREALEKAPAGSDITALRAAVDESIAAFEKAKTGEERLVHADVDADVVARVVSGWTGIPVGKMKTEALSAVLTLEDKLRDRVRGQEPAIRAVSEVIRTARAGIGNPSMPIGVLLFVGPSGVGKTETALTLADALYGGERFMTTINMSEFQEKHTVSRLIGSPPGYVGFGEGGMLTEAVRQRPYSVVLLDECEKADPDVMNLFYQVFDKGMLSDGEGRDVDFKNTVVILTSNLGTDILMKAYDREEPPSVEDVVAQVRPVLSKHFKPALLARMTIVPYAPISRTIMREITQMKLDALAGRLRTAHKIETTFENELIDELTRRCTAAETGARNVEHTLRSSLVPEVSRALLEFMVSGEVPRKLDIGLAPDGSWRIDFTQS